MSRQQQQQQSQQGVVLTGYHSNLEPLPRSGPPPAARPAEPEPQPETNSSRWDLNNSSGERVRVFIVFIFFFLSRLVPVVCRTDSAREQRSPGGLGLRVFQRAPPPPPHLGR